MIVTNPLTGECLVLNSGRMRRTRKEHKRQVLEGRGQLACGRNPDGTFSDHNTCASMLKQLEASPLQQHYDGNYIKSNYGDPAAKAANEAGYHARKARDPRVPADIAKGHVERMLRAEPWARQRLDRLVREVHSEPQSQYINALMGSLDEAVDDDDFGKLMGKGLDQLDWHERRTKEEKPANRWTSYAKDKRYADTLRRLLPEKAVQRARRQRERRADVLAFDPNKLGGKGNWDPDYEKKK